MKKINTVDAVGHVLCHDIARIVIDEVKDTPFRRGHTVTEEDMPLLLSLGKEHLFVMEPDDMNKVHEEEVAQALFEICDGPHIYGTPVREGKIEAFADEAGLLCIDVPRLHAINSVGDITIVTKLNHTAITKDGKIAGVRCIPLLLPKEELVEAQRIAGDTPLMEIKPFVIKKVGVVTTGSEVFKGRIKDAFTPIVKERIEAFGMSIVAHEIVPDDTEQIVAAIQKVIAEGAELVFCTGGMSVDPDDLTPGAISQCADEVVTYGLPVLPGSMVCIAYQKSGLPIVGLPGGVLFSKPTAFDAILPRLAARDKISKADCIAMGHGGLM